MRSILTYLLLLSTLGLSAQEVIYLDDSTEPSTETRTPMGDMPGDILYNVNRPSITAYLPEPGKWTGPAVLIAPGGGFYFLAIDHEGTEVAEWLNEMGIAAFVLKYRTVPLESDNPKAELWMRAQNFTQFAADNAEQLRLATDDALAAMTHIRENAERYHVDADRIGMMGFSAGGNLTLSTMLRATDATRPDFIAPIYPWDGAPVGRMVPEGEQPVFLAVAEDDPLGLADYTRDLYERWTAARHPVTLHLYPTGGHGFGMRRFGRHADAWTDHFADWLSLEKLRLPKQTASTITEEGLAGNLKWLRDFDANSVEDFGWLHRYRDANAQLGKPTDDEQRVVFIGNSITEGWARMDSAWFARNNYVGRGISGQTSPQLLVRFRQDVVDLDPAAVVIFIGTNDVAGNTGPMTPQQTVDNIIGMTEIARANGIVPIIASVLPADQMPWRPGLDTAEPILEINRLLARYAKAQNLVYLDFHTAMKNDRNGLDPELAEDGVHPTLKAYRDIMAPLAERAVAEALK